MVTPSRARASWPREGAWRVLYSGATRKRLAPVRHEDRYMFGLLCGVDSIILVGATQNVVKTLVNEGVIDIETD